MTNWALIVYIFLITLGLGLSICPCALPSKIRSWQFWQRIRRLDSLLALISLVLTVVLVWKVSSDVEGIAGGVRIVTERTAAVQQLLIDYGANRGGSGNTWIDERAADDIQRIRNDTEQLVTVARRISKSMDPPSDNTPGRWALPLGFVLTVMSGVLGGWFIIANGNIFQRIFGPLFLVTTLFGTLFVMKIEKILGIDELFHFEFCCAAKVPPGGGPIVVVPPHDQELHVEKLFETRPFATGKFDEYESNPLKLPNPLPPPTPDLVKDHIRCSDTGFFLLVGGADRDPLKATKEENGENLQLAYNRAMQVMREIDIFCSNSVKKDGLKKSPLVVPVPRGPEHPASNADEKDKAMDRTVRLFRVAPAP